MSAHVSQDVPAPVTEQSPVSDEVLAMIPDGLMDNPSKATKWINNYARNKALQDLVHVHQAEFDMLRDMWKESIQKAAGWKDRRL